jgi:hypothetical protein
VGTNNEQRLSFLIRLWKVSQYGEWRISVRDLMTLETVYLPSLEALMLYLHDRANYPCPPEISIFGDMDDNERR